MARAEAYLLAKFHRDPSNRLATIHQRHRQTGQTGQRSDSIGRTVLQTVAQKWLVAIVYAILPVRVRKNAIAVVEEFSGIIRRFALTEPLLLSFRTSV